MSAFPYLVMTSRNRRQYSATKASRGAPNGTGYKGWYNPNQPRIMEAGEPLNAIIPRDEWIERITTGQGSMLSDIVKQAGIPVKNQDGLGYCWVYGSTSCVEERKQRPAWRRIQDSFRHSKDRSPANR